VVLLPGGTHLLPLGAHLRLVGKAFVQPLAQRGNRLIQIRRSRLQAGQMLINVIAYARILRLGQHVVVQRGQLLAATGLHVQPLQPTQVADHAATLAIEATLAHVMAAVAIITPCGCMHVLAVRRVGSGGWGRWRRCVLGHHERGRSGHQHGQCGSKQGFTMHGESPG